MGDQAVQRAYSTFHIKSFDEEQRIVVGIASTPEADRGGDRMTSKGARFKLPMPFRFQHSDDIGEVFEAEVTKSGITIKARVLKIAEAGRLRDEIEYAWQYIKNGLAKGLSIGWSPIVAARNSFGGLDVAEWDWLETSAVAIPMNASATIQRIKSVDQSALAASGKGRSIGSFNSGATDSLRHPMKNYSEQITEKRTLLQTKSARLEELMADQDTNGGLEDAEQKELDTVTGEVDALTKGIGQLEVLERAQLSQAKRVDAPAGELPGTPGRTKVEVKELPKGTLFTRYAMAKAAGKGSYSDTIEYAKRFSNTPQIVQFLKAEAGTAVVQSPGWGGELVNPDTMQTEFVELLRPQTIIGRVNGFRRVPFNIPIITQTGGSTFNWVGEGAPKPVGELAFDRTTMSNSKVAGIVVLTDELVRLSTPSAEATVRQDLIDQCAKFLDEQFIQVGISAGASNPASITNGVSSPSATGTTAAALRHDLNIALANFDSNGVTTEGLVIVMTPALARGISLLTTSLGVPEFPGMTPNGGTLLGYPVIVSASVDSGTVVIFKPSEILLADDGRVTLDSSNQASLDMSGSTNATFSLWQNNCVGLRAEQWIRWQKRRALGTVAVIDTAAYAPA